MKNSTIKAFEDLVIWQEARVLAKCVFLITSSDLFSRDIRFRSQLRAASGSIMDNIAEGFGREGTREFIQFLYMAKGSCSEVRSQSYRALDYKYISEGQQMDLLNKTQEISQKTQALINYLKKVSHKGYKYHIKE